MLPVLLHLYTVFYPQTHGSSSICSTAVQHTWLRYTSPMRSLRERVSLPSAPSTRTGRHFACAALRRPPPPSPPSSVDCTTIAVQLQLLCCTPAQTHSCDAQNCARSQVSSLSSHSSIIRQSGVCVYPRNTVPPKASTHVHPVPTSHRGRSEDCQQSEAKIKIA